jgi:zinc finger protein ZFPM1
MEFDALMEGKENLSVSGDSVTPEQIVCAPSLPGSPPLTPSPKRRSNSPRCGNISVSPNSSTSASHSLLMRSMLPADIALRLSDPSLNVIPPQMLVKQSVELALRLSSAGSNETSPPQISPLLNIQQPPPLSSPNNVISPVVTPGLPVMPSGTLIKQGVSKCKECNIVFCKYENYLAHKKHYCSARNIDDSEGTTKSQSPDSPQSKSPSGGNLTYQQLICVACGIKFTTWDNLSAHQMYYCPKRVELQAQANSIAPATNAHKEKCSKCKSIHDPSQQCTVAGTGAYKCPICEAISPNSTEARRHMESHGGVKAFRCTICRYKGNTLR